ncbi:PTS galactitol transporter subunit IIC [Gilliamella apicola]|uniref:PTS galactitol transporter subunit IIC n=1 Tax=Gilliamella apicola TaxID=1196095 RepID=UPI00117B86AE|nr:galactitol-specific PTS transporter subunit IIC [Gilliamella apicola]
MFTEIMQYILDLGPSVMLPIVIILFSLVLRMKVGDALKAGIHIGIGFVGIGLVVGLLTSSVGPAAQAMAERFDISLNVVDVGWPGAAPMTWASQIALVAIPIAIAVNIVMLLAKLTRVVNVDIWNIWHMTFSGALVYIATGSYWLGIAGVIVHAIIAYKLGDWFSKVGDALKAGIHIGIGFVGIGLVVGLLTSSVGPAAQAMAERFDISLNVVDVGWPGAAPMTWASQIALVAIPIAIAVNIVMLLAKLTRVVNVDIWNIWHMTFSGALVYIATGSYWLGIAGVIVHAIIAYKLGDWFSKDTKEFFELEGIAVPHGTSAYCGPIAVFVDAVIEKIPGINKINFNAVDMQKRFGAFGEPVTVGLFMGIMLGLLAGYGVKETLQLAIQTAAVMLLMPRVIKPIMDGLTPISKQARKHLQSKFGGQDFLIGLDPALLLGHSTVVSASLIFIPLSIFIAIILPGNEVLPFGDLATIGFFIAMSVAIHQGNLFRIIISGSIIIAITLWIATQMVPLTTQLAINAGTITDGSSISVGAMDQGGSPITYIMVQLVKLKQPIGFAFIGLFYLFCLFLTWKRAKRYELFLKEQQIAQSDEIKK